MKSTVSFNPPPFQPPPVRLPKTWPHVIRNGDVAVKIYKNQGHVRGENFPSFVLSYYASGKRQLRRFTDFTKASNAAILVAQQKAQGALGAAGLSASDRVSLEQALVLLGRNEGIGNASASRLVEIVRDYTTARANLPAGVTLAECAQFYKQKHPANMLRKTVAEVVAEFIADRRSAECSPVHLRDLGIRLGQFSRAFVLPINAVNAQLVQQWIYGLLNQKTKKATAGRTKGNMLRQIVSLFNFARRRKYVAGDLALEISEISAPKRKPGSKGIYTPDEMRAILAAAHSDIIPALAIAAFAGLRLAEIARLDWNDVKLSERRIVVMEENKTGRRAVPVSDNLAAWLADRAKRSGPVSPCVESPDSVGNALGDRFERARKRAKVNVKPNGYRHSQISYRVAETKNVPAVALESGNSVPVIMRDYLSVATDEAAKAWFAILPPKQAGNVVPLQIAAHG